MLCVVFVSCYPDSQLQLCYYLDPNIIIRDYVYVLGRMAPRDL